jgi:hypothetical protein
MAIPSSAVQALYIAFFNRPADAAGFGFWVAQGDINAVARTFTGSPEYVATHAGMSATALVTEFYQNLFGRAPDADGLAFWVDALNRNVLDAASLAVTLARVAIGTDGATLANKIALASSFTSALDTPARQSIYETHLSAASVKTLINGVGADAGTLASALTNVVPTIDGLFPVSTPPVVTPPVVPGFALTVSNDTYAGGVADDTITGTVGGASTFNAGDVLNGGAGDNTLALTTTANFTLDNTKVTNVQTLQVKATSATTVSISGAGGPSVLTNDGSTASLTFGAPGAGLNVPATININGATADTEVVYNHGMLTGGTDAATVNLNGVGAAGTLRGLTLRSFAKDANELESLTISATGTNGILLSTDDTQTSLATLNITGSGSLVLELAAAPDRIQSSLATINAAAATGNLVIGSLTTPVGAATTSITLGSGNDTVFMGNNLSSATTLLGNGGTDTVVVTRALTAGDVSATTGFETIRFDSTSGAITQNTNLAGVVGLGYEVQGANTISLSGLTNNAVVKVSAFMANTLSMSLFSNAGLTDALTLALAGNGDLTTLFDVTGLETLNIALQGANSMITNDLVAAKHVITGAGNLVIANQVAASIVDASAMTGNLSLITATTGTTVTGGSGNDQITGNVAADTINVGAGNDAVVLGVLGLNATSGADRINLGSGNDTVTFVGNNAAGDGGTTGYATFAEVSAFTVGAAGATDRLAFSNRNSDFSLNGATGLAKGAVAQGLNSGDAMVLQEVRTSGTVAATANVSFFKLGSAVVPVDDIKQLFKTALATDSVTGLAVNGNYAISAFDSTAQKLVVGVVNVGANGTLESADFTDATLAIVGTINMSFADHSTFNGTQLAVAA